MNEWVLSRQMSEWVGRCLSREVDGSVGGGEWVSEWATDMRQK